MSNPGKDDHRGPQQAAHEQALGGVSDVLLNLEHTLVRSKKALARVKNSGGDNNIELALTELIVDLERNHQRFRQDSYYAGGSLPLI